MLKNEVFSALAEGDAEASDIDGGRTFGCHPIGPLALADLVGRESCSR
jgi:3-hydroxyacyl-CoA dehydrogenase